MSHHDDIETRNREELPFSSCIVPGGLIVAEAPQTAFRNAARLYSDKGNPLIGIRWRLEPVTSRLAARYRNQQATADPSIRGIRLLGHGSRPYISRCYPMSKVTIFFDYTFLLCVRHLRLICLSCMSFVLALCKILW